MKKVLITGASGFIGSFLVEEALSRGYEVIAGIRKSSSMEYLTNKAIKVIHLDLSDKQKLSAQINTYSTEYGRFDYVIHNAGATKVKNKSHFSHINTDYTKNLIYALSSDQVKPDKFIFLSSLAAFGPAPSKYPSEVKLTDKPNPVNLYGKSKYDAENYLATLKDFPYIIFRPTGVYGPREKDYFIIFKMLKRHIEAYIGFEKQWLTFIYVKDLVRLIIDAMASEIKNKSYFAADGDTYESKEFNKIAKQIIGTKAIPIRVPLWIVKCMAWILENSAGLFGKYPTLNLDKYKIIASRNWKCDITPIIKDFNFKPQYPLESGLKETIDWYKNEGWL